MTSAALEEVEPWDEPVNGAVLLTALAEVLRRFVVLPKWAAETLALWVLHTFAFELRNVSTYIGVESPEKRCGKTTLLAVLSELVNRPVVASNISPPAFFRVIEELRPTLLIDETDTFLQGSDELGGILNAGYSRKTAFVYRVQSPNFEVQSPKSKVQSPEVGKAVPPHPSPARTTQDTDPSGSLPQGEGAAGLPDPDRTPLPDPLPFQRREGVGACNGGSRLGRFSCWCPKVMCCIGRLPDTLADRCIVIKMQRKTIHEECERLRNLEVSDLLRKCARFVLDHAEQIAKANPEIPESLNDRAADIWEPLLTLAELAGGEWPELGRSAAVALTASSQENSPIGSLLFDIFMMFIKSEHKRLFTRTMVAVLNMTEDRPWMEMKKGKAITNAWLGQKLRPYGLRPRSVRIGEVTAKGYYEDDFMEVFSRYIPRSEFEAVMAERKREK